MYKLYLAFPQIFDMQYIQQVQKIAKEINLSDEEINRVVEVLLPLVRERFRGWQFPTIEIFKENGVVKLKASYIFK